MSAEIISLGATSIARSIRRGDLSPIEATRAFVERIKVVNPVINALITPMFDEALAEAEQATESLARHPEYLPPLYGVPLTVKDSFAVEGARFTVGAIRYRNRVASQDAEAVQRLKAAGAIILGKTNCPELCASADTRNLLFGPTHNPWDRTRSAGGSSGGEAALIACGGSPLGLGSDIAGSIRLPAAFCGVYGFKPSPGLVPLAGHFPHTPAAISDWMAAGPLARHVDDLTLALEVLSGVPLRTLPGDIDNIQVLVPAPLPLPPLSKEGQQAIDVAIETLRAAGMKIVVGEKLPLLDVAFEFSATMEREWLPPIQAALGQDRPLNLVAELIPFRTKRISANVLASLLTIAVVGRVLRSIGYGDCSRLGAIRTRILERMGPGGLLLLPVFHKSAPRPGFVWMPDGSPTYTSIFNALGFPACAVPVGISDAGLPLSVQIVGRPNEDTIVLSAAEILEDALGVMPIFTGDGQGRHQRSRRGDSCLEEDDRRVPELCGCL